MLSFSDKKDNRNSLIGIGLIWNGLIGIAFLNDFSVQGKVQRAFKPIEGFQHTKGSPVVIGRRGSRR